MTIDPSVFAALTLPANNVQAGTSVLLIATPPQMPPKIAGEVVNIDRSGQVVIQTDAGEVIIKTDLPLTVGQKVEIKLPPPQLNAPPIATLVPQAMPAAPRAEAATVAQMHPAVVMDLAAPEEFSTFARNAPVQVTPMAPVSYTPASNIPPAQTLFQLIGQNLPATMIPAPTAQPAPMQPSNPAMPGTMLSSNPVNHLPLNSTPMMMPGFTGPAPATTQHLMPLERVQILFMGGMVEAKTQLEILTKQPAEIAARMSTPNAPMTAPGMANTQSAAPGQNFPLLAQLTGLTLQKLPVFEVLSSPMSGTTMSSEQGIAQKSQIIVHAPVLMTGPEQQQQTGMSTVLLARMPATPLPPEGLFAVQTLSQQAPLLMQILQDPSGFMPPEMMAMAAPIREHMPKPNSPQFAMQLIASILGFSKAEPRSVLGQKIADALKPEQAEQLGKELQKLTGLTREGAAPPAEGMRFNFPVEMAGQFYLWQMTLRPAENNKDGGQNGFMTEKPSRFILDLYMSRLGAMQVDGLSYAKARKLDVILRTKEALPASAKDTLLVQAMSVFDSADLKGTIAFQTY